MNHLRWVAFFIWVLIICWLSFSPLYELTIKQPLGADKLAHIGMYAILGSVVVWTTSLSKWRSKLFIFSFILAAATEVVQHLFILNRTGDLYDFIANCVGLFIVLFTRKRCKKT